MNKAKREAERAKIKAEMEELYGVRGEKIPAAVVWAPIMRVLFIQECLGIDVKEQRELYTKMIEDDERKGG